MNAKLITTSVFAAAAALAFSSCSSTVSTPVNVGGDYAKTGGIRIDRTDCKLICGRAIGESKGLKILGFIPISHPSEATAVANMYENARQRGAKLEGGSVTFANTSVEESSNYYILWSRPTIKASGDAVEYVEKE